MAPATQGCSRAPTPRSVDDDVVHRAHGRQGLAGEDGPAQRHAGQAPQRLFLGQVPELALGFWAR
jgi:hypothetical protein